MDPTTVTNSYQDKLPYDQVATVISEGGILITLVLPLAVVMLLGCVFVMVLAWRRGKEWNDVGVVMREDLDPKYLAEIKLDEVEDHPTTGETQAFYDKAG